MVPFSWALTLLSFSLLVIAVAAVRSFNRRLRGDPPPLSRRARRHAVNVEAEQILKGIVPASVVAALIFPCGIEAATSVYAFYIDPRFDAGGIEDVGLTIASLGIVFLFFALCWALGIVCILPIWKLFYQCGLRGPFAAATLGAFASVGLSIIVPPLGLFAWPVLEEPTFSIYMAVTGAIGGTVLWWMGYRPEQVRACLRRHPISNTHS